MLSTRLPSDRDAQIAQGRAAITSEQAPPAFDPDQFQIRGGGQSVSRGGNIMSMLEMLFGAAVICGFVVFAGSLAWAQHQTRNISH
jgi:hypothetical protein